MRRRPKTRGVVSARFGRGRTDSVRTGPPGGPDPHDKNGWSSGKDTKSRPKRRSAAQRRTMPVSSLFAAGSKQPFRLTSGLWFPRRITRIRDLPSDPAARWAARESKHAHPLLSKPPPRPVTPPTAAFPLTKASRRRLRRQNRRRQTQSRTIVVWFRDDLRLEDNEALSAAAASGARVVPAYVWCEREEGKWGVRGAARFWLARSLMSLDESLRRRYGSRLVLRAANKSTHKSTLDALVSLAHDVGADAVYYSTVYTPWIRTRDESIARALQSHNVQVRAFQGSTLYDILEVDPDRMPGALSHGFGSVRFYLRASQRLGEPREPIDAPKTLRSPDLWPSSETHESLGLARLPTRRSGERVDWTRGISLAWDMSESGAHEALDRFLKEGVYRFESRQRHRADQSNTAIISPFVRFGQISPQTVYHAAKKTRGAKKCKAFLRRLAWRDLAYWMLHKFPTMPDRSIRRQYEKQRWSEDPNNTLLRAWKTGQTGFPLVDAGMRQLWVMGWMPNYMRHVVAGFLVEYLNLSWKLGADWFHDTLVDADVAINAHMWQNGGHSGVDQWNFVMHPVYAAKTCDPDGNYTRQWVSEISQLPDEYVHCPWEAPSSVHAQAGFRLGRDYPRRIVTNLNAARINSLRAVIEVRNKHRAQLVLPCGNERVVLDDGRPVRCITRIDYRTDSDRPVTKQTIDETKWQGPRTKAQRDNNPLRVAMKDTLSRHQRTVELIDKGFV